MKYGILYLTYKKNKIVQDVKYFKTFLARENFIKENREKIYSILAYKEK